MTEVKKYTEAFEKGRTGKSAVLSSLYRISLNLNNKLELLLSESSITLTSKEKELPLLLQSTELLKLLIKKIRALFSSMSHTRATKFYSPISTKSWSPSLRRNLKRLF